MHNLLSGMKTILWPVLLIGIVACSGGGSDSDDVVEGTVVIPTTVEELIAPTISSVVPGDGEITVTWDPIIDTAFDSTDGGPIIIYNLYYANATTDGITIANLASIDTTVDSITEASGFGSELDLVDTTFTITGLDNFNLYYFVVTAQGLPDVDTGEFIEGPASDEGHAMPRVSVVTAQSLTDTGTTLCGDFSFELTADVDADGDGMIFESDNRLDCSDLNADDDGDPVPAPLQQDAGQGLDADSATNDPEDGIAGFSYTKLDENGIPLPADAAEWSCVQDNVTGLIWESKTTDGGLHNASDRFSWYNTDTTLNGEISGFNGLDDAQDLFICSGYTIGDESTYCNTEAFVDRVNIDVLCGFSDWRMPTLIELRSLVNYEQANPVPAELVASIDLAFFPNTQVDGGSENTTIDGGVRYWSSQTLGSNAAFAWSMFYGFGGAPALIKTTDNAVRLVRANP